MNSPALLTLPNYSPQLGNLPRLPEGYVGYFESHQHGQMIFAYSLRTRTGNLYVSSMRWRPIPCSPHCLPVEIAKGSPEAQWLTACWESALAISMKAAIENLFGGEVKAKS